MSENNIGPHFHDFTRMEQVDGEQVEKQYFGLFSSRFDLELEKKQLALNCKLEIVLAYLQSVERTSM